MPNNWILLPDTERFVNIDYVAYVEFEKAAVNTPEGPKQMTVCGFVHFADAEHRVVQARGNDLKAIQGWMRSMGPLPPPTPQAPTSAAGAGTPAAGAPRPAGPPGSSPAPAPNAGAPAAPPAVTPAPAPPAKAATDMPAQAVGRAGEQAPDGSATKAAAAKDGKDGAEPASKAPASAKKDAPASPPAKAPA